MISHRTSTASQQTALGLTDTRKYCGEFDDVKQKRYDETYVASLPEWATSDQKSLLSLAYRETQEMARRNAAFGYGPLVQDPGRSDLFGQPPQQTASGFGSGLQSGGWTLRPPVAHSKFVYSRDSKPAMDVYGRAYTPTLPASNDAAYNACRSVRVAGTI